MNRLLTPLSFAAACIIAASPAHALLRRAWVSGHGIDNASCGPAASPCRTFQYVINNIVAVDGEIDVAGPAGYGPIIIDRALSIVTDGAGTAGVLPSGPGGNGVTINLNNGATYGSGYVYLRGLEIEGLGSGQVGVAAQIFGRLVLTNCTVRHFIDAGLKVLPPGNNSLVVAVSNSNFSDNGGDGVRLETGGGFPAITALFDHAMFSNNRGAGLVLHNGAAGGGSIYAAVFANSATGNVTGVSIDAASSGQSYGDNKIEGNSSTQLVGTLAPLASR